MKKDEVFKEPYARPSDFKFNSKVAGVFDDMVNRSVPYYEEMQRMIAELAADHCIEGTSIYDLGCSTGTTLVNMERTVPGNIPFVGVDDSRDMIEKCREKFIALDSGRNYELVVADLNKEVPVKNASVVILCLTLQFVRPMHRQRLLEQISAGLDPNGVLIIVEKILAEDSGFNRDFIKYYYNMKRRHHYSEMEISQKREALENVLIPYKLSENIALLKDVGFQNCEIFFKWYNFTGIIAKKAS
jgi:tRNA (cmo5U34)-methyltransferase